MAETDSPAGWGSPRRQLVTAEDEWEAVISVNGHAYTADKRSGVVFYAPPEEGREHAGAERVEVGRWDPVQTLIVFNDASAERDRLCGLATARIGGGTDGQNDLAAAMTDVSPRSIAAAVRRKQRQKEQSKEQQQQQQLAASGGDSEKKQAPAPSVRQAVDSVSRGSINSMPQPTGRVASWAGPPQLILTEDENDIIVEVLEEVYLVDLVRRHGVPPPRCLLYDHLTKSAIACCVLLHRCALLFTVPAAPRVVANRSQGLSSASSTMTTRSRRKLAVGMRTRGASDSSQVIALLTPRL